MHAFFFNPPIYNNFIGHQMAEIYKDKIYDPFLVGKKGLTILDIGANLGIATYYFAHFAEKVYAVEPAFEHFDVLYRMVHFNGLTNVEAIKQAVGLKPGVMDFYHNKVNKTMFSLSPQVNDSPEDVEKVEVVTIDQLFKENNIEKCDFLKMDVEGSEAEIVCGPDFKKVAPKIKDIVLESHAWANRNPAQIIDALKMNGFKVGQLPNDANIIFGRK